MECIELFTKLQTEFEKSGMDTKEIDINIALDMSQNFTEKEIFEVIKNYSHRADDDSTKAAPYSKEIIKNIKNSYEKIKNKTKIKTDKLTNSLVSKFVKSNKISRNSIFKE